MTTPKTRLKVLFGIAIFSLFILAYISVRNTIGEPDLKNIEVKLTSVSRAGDKPEYLVLTISMRSLSDRSVYLEKLNENTSLYIEGKEYWPRSGNRPKIRLSDSETLFELAFKIDNANPENSLLRIRGTCLNSSTNDYEILVNQSTDLNRRAVIAPKRQ